MEKKTQERQNAYKGNKKLIKTLIANSKKKKNIQIVYPKSG